MFLISPADKIPVGDAGVYALLGYAIVFTGLIALMLVVMFIGKCFIMAANKKNKKAAEAAPVEVTVTPVEQPVAPGAAGDLKLHNVEPKTAAMLMAIVADKLGKPLNELRFLSIREVDE